MLRFAESRWVQLLAIFLLALVLAPLATAQIQYGTSYVGPACANPKNLDGVAIPPGSYCVVLTGCKPPPEGIPFVFDNTTPYPPEKQAPCDFGGGEGKLIPFESGVHTIEAAGLTATFTVVQPMPPDLNPTTGTKITWTNATTNSDGSPLTNLAGVRFYANGEKVAELGPTVTSWNPPASGTYDLVSYTTAGAESAHVVVAFTLASTPPPIPVDCQVGPWASGTPWPWTPTVCTTGTQTRSVPQTRTVTTPAANGGAACPALAQSITETQTCTIPAPIDVCKADPLILKVTGWPGGNNGSRSLSYTTNKPITTLSLVWPLKLSVTDTRGCSASVVK